MNMEETIKRINTLCRYADVMCETYTIAFITSHKDKTNNTNDYHTFSVKSEFYSDELQNKIVDAFHSCGFAVKEFYNEEDFISYVLKSSKKELSSLIVINSAQKGTNIGRKSLIPALCDLYNIQYVGSNPYIVSLCRDKYRCSNILEQNSIRTPHAWLFSPKYGWLNEKPDSSVGRVIIKPNYESSSIGVDSDCIGEFNLKLEKKIHDYSKSFNQDILVEEFISGYEVETPVICAHSPLALFPVGIGKNGQKEIGDFILDYTTRSQNYYNLYNFEMYDKALSNQLIETALKTVNLLDIQGFGRIDFRITKSGKYYVTDISTNPHYTEHSSFFYIFSEFKMSYEKMLKCLIASKYERSASC